MAALQRALALAEVHDVAVAVAEDLHFDVARALDPLLDDDAVVTERGPRFALRSRGGLLQLRGGADDAHALAAATGDRLDDNRIASVLARRNHGHAGRDRGLLGAALVAHHLDRPRERAHPRQPGVDDRAREGGVLAEKPVPGVHGACAGPLGRLQDVLDRQVRADAECLVDALDVQGAVVGAREHADASKPEPVHGARDAHCNLAAVRDQHGGELTHGATPWARR